MGKLKSVERRYRLGMRVIEAFERIVLAGLVVVTLWLLLQSESEMAPKLLELITRVYSRIVVTVFNLLVGFVLARLLLRSARR